MRKTCQTRNVCASYFIFFMLLHETDFLSRISNRLVVEAVIIHEAKGFSRAISNKIIVRENNRITKCLLIIFMLPHVCPFFSCISSVFLVSWMSRKLSVASFTSTSCFQSSSSLHTVHQVPWPTPGQTSNLPHPHRT